MLYFILKKIKKSSFELLQIIWDIYNYVVLMLARPLYRLYVVVVSSIFSAANLV